MFFLVNVGLMGSTGLMDSAVKRLFDGPQLASCVSDCIDVMSVFMCMQPDVLTCKRDLPR